MHLHLQHLLILLLLMVVCTISQSNELGDCRWRVALHGGTVQSLSGVPTIGQCEAECRKDKRCKAYTYMTQRATKGTCAIKWAAHGPPVKNEVIVRYNGAISSIIDCHKPGSCLKERIGYRNGWISTIPDLADHAACWEHCNNTDNCAVYTFSTVNGECILRDSDAYPLGSSSDAYISGIMMCGGPPPVKKPQCNLDDIRPAGVKFTRYPLCVGEETVSYCVEDPRKNTVIRCTEQRELAKWEFPDCTSDILVNTGHCEYEVPDGVLVQPSASSSIAIGSFLVARCQGSGDVKILPCHPQRPILTSDFPVCTNE